MLKKVALLSIWCILVFVAALPNSAFGQVEPVNRVYQRSWIDFGVAGASSSLRILRKWVPHDRSGSKIFSGHWCSNWDLEILDGATPFPKFKRCEQSTIFEASKIEKDLFTSQLEPFARLKRSKSSKGTLAYEYENGGEKLTFSAEGRLARLTNAHGVTFTLTYEGNHIFSIVRSDHKGIQFVYKNANVESIVALPRNSRTAPFELAKSNEILVRYEYDGDSLNSVSPKEKPILRYRYDSDGRIIEVLSDDKTFEQIHYLESATPFVASIRSVDSCLMKYKFEAASIEKQPSKTIIEKSCPGKKNTIAVFEYIVNSLHAKNSHLIATSARSGTEVAKLFFDPRSARLNARQENGVIENYQYDNVGRMTSIVNLKNKDRFDFSFAPQDCKPNLMTWKRSSGSSTMSIRYNSASQVIGLQQPLASLAFAYDGNDRVSRILLNGKTLVKATYLIDGELAQIKVARRPARAIASIKTGNEMSPTDVFTLLVRIRQVRDSEHI